jgi:hypothetical protein
LFFHSFGFMDQKITVKKDAKTTEQIISALTNALPAAVSQMEELAPGLGIDPQNEMQAAKLICQFVQDHFVYVSDPIQEQNIKFPSAMLRTRAGDCKSFTLFCLSYLTFLGVPCGFCFVSYPDRAKQITHVYCYFVDNGIKIYFDPCITGFREVPTFVKKVDMDINYIAQRPVVTYSGSNNRISGLNTLFAAPVRTAGLILIRLNYRGWATALDVGIQNNPAPARNFWEDFGGQWSKFLEAVNAGKNKNPLIGGGAAYDEAIGDTWYGLMEQQNYLNDLLQNAIQQGFVPPITPVNWSNPSLKTAYLQWLMAFYSQIGNAVNTGVPVDPAQTPAARPVSDAPIITPPKGKSINMTGAEIAALVGVAVPLLVAIPGLLDSMGITNVPAPIEEGAATGDQMNPVNDSTDIITGAGNFITDVLNTFFPPPNTPGETGATTQPFFRLSNPIVLLGGGVLAYKFLKPKRKKSR